jgi:hypothetical protein
VINMVKRPRTGAVEAPDAAAVEVRAVARKAGVEVMNALLTLALSSKSDPVKLSAIKEVLDRGFGRPAAAPSEGGAGATAHLLVDDGYAD